jgi:predicted transcriptional regulator
MVKTAMLETLRVKDVMTEAIVLLRAEMSVDEAWELFHRCGVTGAPVLDARGRLAGVLSTYDLADPRRREPGASARVGDLMTRMAFAVRAEDPVLAAVRLMAEENIHRVLVVHDDGTLAGVVVPMDILRSLAADLKEARIEYFDLRTLAGRP